MFWTGLLPHLKYVAGYKYDTIHDFDTLRVAKRQTEEHTMKEREESSFRKNLYHLKWHKPLPVWTVLNAKS